MSLFENHNEEKVITIIFYSLDNRGIVILANYTLNKDTNQTEGENLSKNPSRCFKEKCKGGGFTENLSNLVGYEGGVLSKGVVRVYRKRVGDSGKGPDPEYKDKRSQLRSSGPKGESLGCRFELEEENTNHRDEGRSRCKNVVLK